ncbi:MAG: hypothetical protein JRJ58_13160, partial [Deltaproteobacteria bacterium]|nr:hypothetical protein [Deltaproteobacteria bacterium]
MSGGVGASEHPRGGAQHGVGDDDGTGSLESRIRRVATALGLDAVGFAKAEPTDRTRFLRDWVARGYVGEMHYITRRLEERVDPRLVLPEARSLVVVGVLCASDPEPPRTAGEPR